MVTKETHPVIIALCKMASQARILLLVRSLWNQAYLIIKYFKERLSSCDEGFKTLRKVQEAPAPSLKVESAEALGHHRCRAAQERQQAQWSQDVGGRSGVQRGSKGASAQGKTSETDWCYSEGTAEDSWGQLRTVEDSWGLLRTGVKLSSLNPLSDYLGLPEKGKKRWALPSVLWNSQASWDRSCSQPREGAIRNGTKTSIHPWSKPFSPRQAHRPKHPRRTSPTHPRMDGGQTMAFPAW